MNLFLSTLLKYVTDRLGERSTWVGIISLLSASGIIVNPALASQFAAIGASVAGLILALTADSPK